MHYTADWSEHPQLTKPPKCTYPLWSHSTGPQFKLHGVYHKSPVSVDSANPLRIQLTSATCKKSDCARTRSCEFSFEVKFDRFNVYNVNFKYRAPRIWIQWAWPSILFMFGSVTNGMAVLLTRNVSVRCRTPDFTQDSRSMISSLCPHDRNALLSRPRLWTLQLHES
jgi:hypothetical protein